jgi:selenide, water dikinase
LTKPLGLGVMATAIKRKKITPKEYHKFLEVACQLNRIGEILGNHEEVHAITDVTGFGLLGHALEMAEGADLSIQLYFQHLPLLEGVTEYIHGFVFPDNTYRNWNAFQGKVSGVQGMDLVVLCDPQTSGGLLISVAEENLDWFETTMALHHQSAWKVGKFIPKGEFRVQVVKD